MQLKHALFLFGATLAFLGGRPAALAQSAAFTYQGRLHDSAGPATGIYDLRFTIYDALSFGNVAGGPLTNGPTAVSNGLFTATLDFGAGVFSGAARWLEIGVRTNGSASDFTALAPRQPLTATPYAVRAANFSGAISDVQLSANIPLLSAGKLPDASLSTNVARLNTSQTFTASNTFAEAVRIIGSKTLEFGAGVTKESNAGKIGYQTFTADTLDIVGAGTNGNARKIKFFAEGGATFNGNLSVDGNAIVGGNVSAPTFTGSGSGLSGLNAANVTSGALPDARLSANVALRSGGNTFSGNQVITNGNVGIGTINPSAKLEVAGTVKATAFSGDGAGLTNLPASATAPPPPGMVLIPAGAFTMGDTLDGLADAVPISVTVSAFYMDVNLVSLSQWQSVYFWATNHGYSFVNVGAGKAANHPVQTVDWFDVVKWSNARSQQAGRTPVYYTDAGLTQVYTNGEPTTLYPNWAASGYRLPTEAEWEKAARGGLSGQRFPWGNVINQNLANYFGATASYSYDLGPNGNNAIGSIGGITPATSPVGSFAANGYGLNDMAGNVQEWCWDWYWPTYAGGSDPHGPAGPWSNRVQRGGAWYFAASVVRCAQRSYNPPGDAFSRIGFRCVRGL